MANKKILIVENTNAFDRVIENRLKNLGYIVCTSASFGTQAIEEIQEMQPDLVIVKLGLEGARAAVETAEEIHYQFNISVLFLIDVIDEDVLERIRRARVFGHIFKPFDSNQLYLGCRKGDSQQFSGSVREVRSDGSSELSVVSELSYRNAAMTRIRKCSKLRNPKVRRLMSLILLLMPSTMPLVVRWQK